MHKCAVEIDKKRHTDKNQNEEKKRQTKIEKHSACKFFHRINPDAESFNIFLEISKTKDYITQSNKQKIKEQKNKIKEQENRIKEQKNKIKKQENKIKEQRKKFAIELLSYVSSISMPVKHISYFVKKILVTL